MLQINNLSMQFGGRVLFKDASIAFTPNECYGIIGANGVGKSTLLRIISGELEPTTGYVSKDPKERMSILKQDHNAFDSEEVLRTVLLGYKRLVEVMDEKDALYSKPDFSEEDGQKAGDLENEFAEMNGWNAESDASNLLNSLGISEEYHHMLMKDLDASMKVKVLLAQALFGDPDILILDEPTNNLDAHSCAWLEEYLINFPNTILIVSHDRYFLNKVCTRILDVDFNEINEFIGNYDFWYSSNQLLQRQMKEQNKKKEERIKELKEFIARFSANASKSKQATSRKKALDKIVLDDIRPSSRRYPFIDFRSKFNLGNDVLKVEKVSKEGFFKDLSFNLVNTDKVAFLSSNSLTITKLFDCLAGKDEFDSGKFKYGITIHPDYIPSSFEEMNDIETNLVEYLRPYGEVKTDSYIRSYLGRMLFTGEEGLKQVKVLSGGEKVRLRFIKVMLNPGNLIILDDPTNHLDLESIESLNRAMEVTKSVLLFSSHDRQIISSIANRYIYIKDDGSYIDMYCTYEEFEEKLYSLGIKF
ncbi:MAG: ATP-binding cassette domain-containing protein [Bacilli bacterium]|nr:ATP-binding cassette domain-containing protein [Bacilli bacterium]